MTTRRSAYHTRYLAELYELDPDLRQRRAITERVLLGVFWLGLGLVVLGWLWTIWWVGATVGAALGRLWMSGGGGW